MYDLIDDYHQAQSYSILLKIELINVLIHRANNKLNSFNMRVTCSTKHSVTISVDSVDDTVLLGSIISGKVTYPGLITLRGDLGMGKTTLARSIISSQLGHAERIQSPSYLICIEYTTPEGDRISHIDTYRLKDPAQLFSLVDEDKIAKDNLCIMEWPSDSYNVFFAKFSDSMLTIEILPDDNSIGGRDVRLTSHSPHWMSFIHDIGENGLDNEMLTEKLSESSSEDSDIIFSTHDKITLKSTEYIMGIETSCDDTCVAILNGDGDILANVRIGQQDVHEKYGGVFPRLAKDAHSANISIAAERAFTESNLSPEDVKAVAVTQGPGLELCLLIGYRYAVDLCRRHSIPLIKCHHLESHVAVCRLPTLNLNTKFPMLTVLVSGGHTMILYSRRLGHYQMLSTSLDDSIGECFDKVARELGIKAIPGGPMLERLARGGTKRPDIFKFSSPYIKASPINMSFSGIKAAAIRMIRGKNLSDELKRDLAFTFQEFVVRYIRRKILASIKLVPEEGISCMVVTGGVAANTRLRSELDDISDRISVPVVYPPVSLCTDNGVMVAWNGVERLREGIYEFSEDVSGDQNHIEVHSRWNL